MTDAAVPRPAEAAPPSNRGTGWLRRALDSDIFYSFRRSRMTMIATGIVGCACAIAQCPLATLRSSRSRGSTT